MAGHTPWKYIKHKHLRNESTPEGKAIWAAVDKAASETPKWLLKRIHERAKYWSYSFPPTLTLPTNNPEVLRGLRAKDLYLDDNNQLEPKHLINIIEAPTVTLIAKPQFIEPAHLPCEWMGEASDGERLAEYAGRLCYLSYHNPAKRTNQAYLENILSVGHGSILEHSTYVFLLEGISRSCSHEIVRHRAGVGYSQVSQRYVDSSQTAFVLPPAFMGNPVATQLWADHCYRAQQLYEILVEENMEKFAHIEDKVQRRKTARESARSVLPNATETKIVMSGNLRAWRTILELRCGEGAEREIRRLALIILWQLKLECPNVFSDFEIYRAPDGAEAALTKHHKV